VGEGEKLGTCRSMIKQSNLLVLRERDNLDNKITHIEDEAKNKIIIIIRILLKLGHSSPLTDFSLHICSSSTAVSVQTMVANLHIFFSLSYSLLLVLD
jgi:hypothetical protein